MGNLKVSFQVVIYKVKNTAFFVNIGNAIEYSAVRNA